MAPAMAAHDMFLAMVLTNAKRAEARAVTLTVDRQQTRIAMQMLDGSSTPLSAPPAEVMIKIIESLEQGQTVFESAVYSITIESMDVQRGTDNMSACISTWTMAHR